MNISVNNDVYEDFIRWENVRKNQIVVDQVLLEQYPAIGQG
jgi:hypothetical protein